MGYTHYYRQTRAFTAQEWVKIGLETKRILAAATAKGITLCGPMGNGAPEVCSDTIALNGDETKGEDYESFVLDRAPRIDRREKESFSFCKTERRPYDPVVVSILVAARKVAPDAIRVSSDGGDEALVMQF